MFAVKKWIAPVAALALLAGVGQFVRAEDAPTTQPAGKATVTVTVLDADSKPVEGVRVMVTPYTPRKKAVATAAENTPDPSTGTHMRAKPIAMGKTDKDGKATLTGVPNGTFNVVASTKEMTGRKRVTITDGKDADVTVTLKPKPAPKGEAPAAPAAPAMPGN